MFIGQSSAHVILLKKQGNYLHFLLIDETLKRFNANDQYKKGVRQNEIVINTFNGTCKHGNCYLQFNPTLDARYEES